RDLNYEATELRLGLPDNSDAGGDGTVAANKKNHYKRASSPPDSVADGGTKSSSGSNTPVQGAAAPVSKALIVGWPPVRSYRRNNLPAANSEKTGRYVKVSMDGAPCLRKIDLRMYGGYRELVKALEDMFRLSIGEYSEREGYIGSEYAPAYEDKDGDLMLVGDVPWPMFISSCKRLRITKGSSETG
ncbi:hypothetical protein M569_04179, partial [Genlisea aurea]